MSAADDFNAKWPVGTRVWFWPGEIEKGKGILSTTRTPAWTLAAGDAVVSVDGYPGGIALTHIEIALGEQPDVEQCGACEETGVNCPEHRYGPSPTPSETPDRCPKCGHRQSWHVDGCEVLNTGKGPATTLSETRQDTTRRASTAIRCRRVGHAWIAVDGDLLADLLAAVAHGTPLPITTTAIRLARSILGEPGDDR